MDTGAQAGWMAALFLGLTLLYMVLTRRQDVSKEKMHETLEPILDEQLRFRAHHAAHFANTESLKSGLARIDQRMRDHEKHDDDRFEQMQEMLGEIRGDIKILIRRSGD